MVTQSSCFLLCMLPVTLLIDRIAVYIQRSGFAFPELDPDEIGSSDQYGETYGQIKLQGLKEIKRKGANNGDSNYIYFDKQSCINIIRNHLIHVRKKEIHQQNHLMVICTDKSLCFYGMLSNGLTNFQRCLRTCISSLCLRCRFCLTKTSSKQFQEGVIWILQNYLTIGWKHPC